MTSITLLCEMACKFVQKKLEEKQLEEERAAKVQNWKLPVCYDDDDDEERSDSLDDNIISGLPQFFAITPNEPVLSTEEPDNSLNQIKDFSESNDEVSSIDDDSFSINKIDYVEALPLDSELVSSEVMEIVIPKVGGIDVDILLTIKDNILREKLLNVNHLFAKIKASNDNPIHFYDPIISGTPLTLTSSREMTISHVLEKIVSKPLFDEEIIPMKIDMHPDNAESNFMESLRIDETDCDFKEDIRLIKKLLYDESSPRPPKEFVSTNSDAAIESLSPSPILVKDSERKSRKGQNRIKTGQKREAWRSPEKSKAVTVNRARKTKENKS
nr:hypothetical protein [Tanacetum cinerariifolium]